MTNAYGEARKLRYLDSALRRFLKESSKSAEPTYRTRSQMFSGIGDGIRTKSDNGYFARILTRLVRMKLLNVGRSKTSNAFVYVIVDPQRLERIISNPVDLAQVLERNFSTSGLLFEAQPEATEPAQPEPKAPATAPESTPSNEVTEAVVAMARHFGALVDTVSQLRLEVSELKSALTEKTGILLSYWEPKRTASDVTIIVDEPTQHEAPAHGS